MAFKGDATQEKQDVIDGYHDVPVEDVATDTQMRDVVGKKSDTVAGTSIIAISKQVKAKTDNIPASPAPSGEYDTEMARITANVATEAKQDVIDGFHDVPGEDVVTDAQMRDVVGKKTDTVAGTSIVAISKQVKAKTDNIPASPAPSGEYDTEMARITANVATEAKQDVIDGFHDVPGEDVVTDAQMRDVVGKKTDTVAGTSIVAISKQVKAKTDNIPASPAPSGEYDTEMARITANVATEAKQDNVILRSVFCMTFWSDVQLVGTITNNGGAGGDVTLPNVVVAEIPSGATIFRVIALLKFRTVEDTSAGANALLGDQYVQVDDSVPTGYTNAIKLVDNQWTIATSETEGGDCIAGAIDVAARVDGNDTYSFKIATGKADANNLVLNEVQVGLMVYFKV